MTIFEYTPEFEAVRQIHGNKAFSMTSFDHMITVCKLLIEACYHTIK